MKQRDVEKYVLKEILKDCSLYERIIVKIFDKEFRKIYNIIRIKLINIWLGSEEETYYRKNYPKITQN